jgi:hypothetical protein
MKSYIESNKNPTASAKILPKVALVYRIMVYLAWKKVASELKPEVERRQKQVNRLDSAVGVPALDHENNRNGLIVLSAGFIILRNTV